MFNKLLQVEISSTSVKQMHRTSSLSLFLRYHISRLHLGSVIRKPIKGSSSNCLAETEPPGIPTKKSNTHLSALLDPLGLRTKHHETIMMWILYSLLMNFSSYWTTSDQIGLISTQ